jgi:hypothetical protein
MRIRISMLVAVVLAASAAEAAETIRCSNRVVKAGDPKAKVAGLCGEPTHKEQRTTYASGFPRQRVIVDGSVRQSPADAELLFNDRSFVEVPVDVWLYNRGSNRLMREIVFRDNRVIEINVLGKGF